MPDRMNVLLGGAICLAHGHRNNQTKTKLCQKFGSVKHLQVGGTNFVILFQLDKNSGCYGNSLFP